MSVNRLFSFLPFPAVFPEHSTYTVPENGRSVEVCFVGRGAPLPQPVALTLSTHNNGSATGKKILSIDILYSTHFVSERAMA